MIKTDMDGIVVIIVVKKVRTFALRVWLYQVSVVNVAPPWSE